MAGPTVITILVVDDDSAVLETVRDGLTSFGYEVLTAEGGDAALQIAAEAQHGSIAVLLVDVVMPGLNGPEVAERVHAIHPDTKRLGALRTAGIVSVRRRPN